MTDEVESPAGCGIYFKCLKRHLIFPDYIYLCIGIVPDITDGAPSSSLGYWGTNHPYKPLSRIPLWTWYRITGDVAKFSSHERFHIPCLLSYIASHGTASR